MSIGWGAYCSLTVRASFVQLSYITAHRGGWTEFRPLQAGHGWFSGPTRGRDGLDSVQPGWRASPRPQGPGPEGGCWPTCTANLPGLVAVIPSNQVPHSPLPGSAGRNSGHYRRVMAGFLGQLKVGLAYIPTNRPPDAARPSSPWPLVGWVGLLLLPTYRSEWTISWPPQPPVRSRRVLSPSSRVGWT